MEEFTIMEGMANRVKSKMSVQNGKGLLTNYRFVYFKHGLAKTLMLGALFTSLTQGDYEFEIPLNQIQSIEKGRQGLNGSVLVIHTVTGETFKFVVSGVKKWLAAMDQAIQAARQTPQQPQQQA